MDSNDKAITGLCQECIDKLKPLIGKGNNPMDAIPCETIYSNGEIVVPLADIQHIEKKTCEGQPNGLWLITKNTHWDMDADMWSNPIYIPQKYADAFMGVWCHFRYEVDGIKE